MASPDALLESPFRRPHSFASVGSWGPLNFFFFFLVYLTFSLLWLFTLSLILKEKHVPTEELERTGDSKAEA